MKYWKLLYLIWIAGLVCAYTNDSMTTPYLELTNNDPIHALMHVYDAQWGDWFYLMLAFGPYVGMWLYQRSFMIPTVWLTCVMISYGFLFDEVKRPVFYLVTAIWFTSIMLKLVSPSYKS